MFNLIARAGRRIRRTTIARRIGDRVLVRQYRIGTPGGLADRAIAWALPHDLAPYEKRVRSVSSLIELFFGIVRLAGVERFVEAGAKDADASKRAAKMPNMQEVVAFEANRYTHKRFAKRVIEEGVDYRHLALGDEPGEIDFYVRLKDDGSPIPDGQASMLIRPDHTPGYERVTVECVRLDDQFALEPRRSTAMWVDVEGASAAVLRGADRLLDSVDVVIIEVEEQRKWTGQEWLHLDVVEHFVQRDLVPIARDRQSRQQFNALFVRRSLLAEVPEIGAAIARWRTELVSGSTADEAAE